MANVNRKCLADNRELVLPTPASTVIEIGDLCFWDDGNNVVQPASAQADQLTESLNQRLFASLFVGVAQQQRLLAETTTGDASRRVFSADGVYLFPCPSTTWEIGDLIGASEAASGTALEDQQVERVTDPSNAIGVCVERTTGAVTQVRCRLTGKWGYDVAESIRRLTQADGAVAVSYVYGEATPLDNAFFVATRAYRVVGITVRPLVVGSDGGAVTATINKAPSGTAMASGTALHASTADLKGTINTNQALTLSTTSSVLEIAAGDAIGMDCTGTMTAARGVVTVQLALR